jgi:hypothetical protein
MSCRRTRPAESLISLTLYHDIGDTEGIPAALTTLGEVAWAQANYERASALLADALLRFQELDDPLSSAECLERLARVVRAQGQPAHGASLCAAAAALREAIGAPLPPVERPLFDQTVATVRAALGTDAFAAAWESGRSLPLEQVIAMALGHVVDAAAGPRPRLPSQVAARGSKEGTGCAARDAQARLRPGKVPVGR